MMFASFYDTLGHVSRHLTAILLLLAVSGPTLGAQIRIDDIVEVDANVHNFGDISATQGPVSCSFTVRNISPSDINIFQVVTTCGCTDVKWTRETIPAGGTGTIEATYKNDEGPGPFEKSLNAYISGVKKPLIFKLKGIVYKSRRPLGESYPMHFGDIALRSTSIRVGNVLQGGVKSTQVLVANIGKHPLKVGFERVSEGLELALSPNPVMPGATSTLTLTVRPGRGDWGECTYYFTPVVGGKAQTLEVVGPDPEKREDASQVLRSDSDPRLGKGGSEIGAVVFVSEDFTKTDVKQRSLSPMPVFASHSFNFPPVKAGTPVHAEYPFSNGGKSLLHFHSAKSGSHGVSFEALRDVEPGGKGVVSVDLDTSGMESGEVTVQLTLVTNSPEKPYVTLYLNGVVE